MVEFGRLITAMVTPFDRFGEVDYGAAKRLATALLDSGSDGVVVTGTTGESPTLNKEEKIRLWFEVKSEVGDRGTVIAGSGSYCTSESIKLTSEAEKTGVDGALLVVPYYNKPPQEGLYQHFAEISANTSLPCIIYNVPSRTVTNIKEETVSRLSQIGNIVGIKEASGDFEQISKIISSTPHDFKVWSGNDGDTLAILSLGGYGVVSVLSHLVGFQIKSMIDGFVDGANEAAASIHHRLLPLVDSMFIVANPIPLKYAMMKVGFDVGSTRLPLAGLDEATSLKIMDEVGRHSIDLPVSSNT